MINSKSSCFPYFVTLPHPLFKQFLILWNVSQCWWLERGMCGCWMKHSPVWYLQNRMWEIKQQRSKNQNLTVFRNVQPMVTAAHWAAAAEVYELLDVGVLIIWGLLHRFIILGIKHGCVVIYMNQIISFKYSLSFFGISHFIFELQEFAVLEQRTLMDDERFISSLK